jgi:hypothetical protein
MPNAERVALEKATAACKRPGKLHQTGRALGAQFLLTMPSAIPRPRIFRRRIEPYQADDLRDFLNVFVDGFYETVRGLLEIREVT